MFLHLIVFLNYNLIILDTTTFEIGTPPISDSLKMRLWFHFLIPQFFHMNSF